jgi:hypothetical protein
VVKANKPDDPLDIAFLGAQRVMADAQHLPHLIEQARRPWQRQVADLDVQHVAIEQGDGIAARRQGADRITFDLGEVIEKLPHFADAHLPWMALAVESDEAFTPIGHGRGRRLGVPLMACGVAPGQAGVAAVL